MGRTSVESSIRTQEAVGSAFSSTGLARRWRSRVLFAGTAALALLVVCNPGLVNVAQPAEAASGPDFEATLDCSRPNRHRLTVDVTDLSNTLPGEKGVILGIEDSQGGRQVLVKPVLTVDGKYLSTESSPVYAPLDRQAFYIGDGVKVKVYPDDREGYGRQLRHVPATPAGTPQGDPSFDYGFGEVDQGTRMPYKPSEKDLIASTIVFCMP